MSIRSHDSHVNDLSHSVVIIGNRRESLNIKGNPSYTTSLIPDLGELPAPPTPSPINNTDHIYESFEN